MEDFFFDLSIILVGSAILSTLAIYLKQPIIFAYILCGLIIGPAGFGFVKNVSFTEDISHLGITLLLFLTGLCLHPQKLIQVFQKTAWVSLANALISYVFGFLVPLTFGFALMDCFIIGLAVMFSSTILVIKLMPTTQLHHKHMGAVCIGVLILQDLLAVAVLAFVRVMHASMGVSILSFIALSGKLIMLIGLLVLFEYYILRRIMAKVDRLKEALFILGLAWCFGVAAVSHHIGLFHETGAFFAGVVLARHPIARYISEELKPLRDFFLVLFFFTLGARIEIHLIGELLVVALLMACFFVFVRPWFFEKLFMIAGEKQAFSKEAGVRLGQISEFALLIGMLAFEQNLITQQAGQLIQLITIFTLIASSYYVSRHYPTPIGVTSKLLQH